MELLEGSKKKKLNDISHGKTRPQDYSTKSVSTIQLNKFSN